MLNVALVGTGYWGPNIAKSFELTEKAKITWLCDSQIERAQQLQSRYPDARLCADYRELLQDKALHAVAISTPARTHFSIAHDCLEAGKHILVEKPLTTDSLSAFKLEQLAKKLKLVMLVGHVFRFNSTLQCLSQIIHKGDLGDVHYLHLERTNLGPVRTDVDVLWDLVSHDVSIMSDLIGASPIAVSSVGQSYLNKGVIDAAFSTFTFAGGQMAHVHASWLNPRKIRRITAVGSKKMATWDDLDLKTPITVYDKHVEFPPSPGDVPDTFMAFKTQVVDGGTYSPEVTLNQPLTSQCAHFIECVTTKNFAATDTRHAIEVILALEAAGKSLQQGSQKIEISRYSDLKAS